MDRLVRPEELEKARAYLSAMGYNLDYEQVRQVIKAYLQIEEKKIDQADQTTSDVAGEILQKILVLFWEDDDSKTAGLLVTGSVVYSELQALKSKYGLEKREKVG